MFSVWLEQPEAIVNALKEVQRRLFTKIVKRLGWDFLDGEDPSTGNLRAVAIRFAGRAGDPEYGLTSFSIVNRLPTFFPHKLILCLVATRI